MSHSIIVHVSMCVWERERSGRRGGDCRSDHVCLTGVFLWMISLLLPRYRLEWIVQAVALRTAASDKHCVKTMCATRGLSVYVCVLWGGGVLLKLLRGDLPSI